MDKSGELCRILLPAITEQYFYNNAKKWSVLFLNVGEYTMRHNRWKKKKPQQLLQAYK